MLACSIYFFICPNILFCKKFLLFLKRFASSLLHNSALLVRIFSNNPLHCFGRNTYFQNSQSFYTKEQFEHHDELTDNSISRQSTKQTTYQVLCIQYFRSIVHSLFMIILVLYTSLLGRCVQIWIIHYRPQSVQITGSFRVMWIQFTVSQPLTPFVYLF